MRVNGLLALIILIADIFVILKISQSSAKVGMKILWIALVIVLPIIGLVAWFFFGPGNKDFKI